MKNFCSKFMSIKNLALFVKIVLLAFITYLNLTKGDSGAITHFIGSALCFGNAFIGLAVFSIIFFMFLLGLLVVMFLCKKISKKFIIISVISDIIFVLVNLFAGIHLTVNVFNMPFADAFGKCAILTCGSGVIFMLLSLIILGLSFI